MTIPPILFLIFNRPDLTQQVFEQIRQASPEQLFIAADGPRADRLGEAALCAEARSIVDKVDWPCEAHTLFRDQNLGCKMAVSGAITWFFEHVEEGIVLEDDCLPHPTFFRYCAELLNRFEDDERIMVISGNNFQEYKIKSRYSYYFSIYNHVWGWASWRRAWMHYDSQLTHWPQLRDNNWLSDIFHESASVKYWRRIFNDVHAGLINNTWDYPWTYSCWVQNGLTILPSVNLVSNIGFDSRGTHTQNGTSRLSNLPMQAMPFPLIHPKQVKRNYQADQYTAQKIFGVRPTVPRWKRLSRRIQQLLHLAG